MVSGEVQGVAYRAFTRQVASRMGLKGGVRNLPDGRVEVDVEGSRKQVEALLDALRTGPPLARVDDLHIEWESPTDRYADFQIWY